MQKLLTFFFSKNISVYAIFDDQNFNDTLTTSLVLNNWAVVRYTATHVAYCFHVAMQASWSSSSMDVHFASCLLSVCIVVLFGAAYGDKLGLNSPPPPPPSTLDVFLLTVQQFFWCSYSLFVPLWFHMWSWFVLCLKLSFFWSGGLSFAFVSPSWLFWKSNTA